MTTGYGQWSRPAIGERGRHSGPLPSIPGTWLRLGIVGRTMPNIRTITPMAEIDRLAEEVGYERPHGWKDQTGTQRLDLLATHIIEESREGYARVSEYVLSPHQWYERTRREIPMSHEQMQAVVNHVPWARLYRGTLKDADTSDNKKSIQSRDASDEIAQRIRR